MSTVAIDFGTSNTVVCIENQVKKTAETLVFPFSLSYQGGPALVPSLIYVEAGGSVCIGRDAAQKSNRTRLFQGFKRELSQEFTPSPRWIDNVEYGPETVAELFLRELIAAIGQQQIVPSQLIASAPVGAYERYLRWLREVCVRFKLPEPVVVDEPTAAALGYAIDEPGALVLVIDLGGGTLDLALVRTSKLRPGERAYRAEVLAKSDRPWGCGGVDIDQWIAEDYLTRRGFSRAQVETSAWQNLLLVAEAVKIRLSTHREARESWLDEESFETFEVHLDRERFEAILEHNLLLERLREAIDEVLDQAYGKGIAKKAIQHVLLVGGTSLIPAVQKLVTGYFGRERVHFGRPFEAVAHGALSLAHYSSLDDLLRHTYALRHWNPYARHYEYLPIFASGTSYPATAEPVLLQANASGQ